jgi:osmotically-inducible protein OsmY
MTRKILAGMMFVVIVGGSIAASKKTDAEILTKVGRTAANQVMQVLPEREQVAGPLSKLQFDAITSTDERVRVRLRTDAGMEGAKITVTSADGVVKLGGKAETSVQRERAVQLAQSAIGVTKVEQEIAVPAGK